VYTGASLNAGFLQTGTASFPIGLPFDATGTQPPLLFNLEAARLEGDVLASNILNGRIGGFLRSEVFSQKLPEVAFSLSLFIDQEAANFAASQGAPGPISCVGDSIGVSAACGSTGRCTTTDGQTTGICISRLSDAVSLLLFTDNASSGGNGNGKLDVIDQNGDGRFSPGDGDQNEIGLFFNVDPRGIASGVIGQHFTLDLDGDGDGDALAVAVFFSAVAAVIN
jgi:hypothetical protein